MDGLSIAATYPPGNVTIKIDLIKLQNSKYIGLYKKKLQLYRQFATIILLPVHTETADRVGSTTITSQSEWKVNLGSRNSYQTNGTPTENVS